VLIKQEGNAHIARTFDDNFWLYDSEIQDILKDTQLELDKKREIIKDRILRMINNLDPKELAVILVASYTDPEIDEYELDEIINDYATK